MLPRANITDHPSAVALRYQCGLRWRNMHPLDLVLEALRCTSQLGCYVLAGLHDRSARGEDERVDVILPAAERLNRLARQLARFNDGEIEVREEDDHEFVKVERANGGQRSNRVDVGDGLRLYLQAATSFRENVPGLP